MINIFNLLLSTFELLFINNVFIDMFLLFIITWLVGVLWSMLFRFS